MSADLLPDGFVVDNLIVFGGPSRGVISMGFEIDTPNLQSASYSECNQVQDAISMMLRQIPEGMNLQLIQFQAPVDTGILLDYQRSTEACQNPTARTLRNANLIQQWNSRESGKLLRKRVILYASYHQKTHSRPSAKAKGNQHRYDQLLTEVKSAFSDFEQSLVQALAPIGGRVTPLTESENVRLWADALNPSLTRQPNYEPVATFDRTRSLLDNFWNSELRGLGRHGFVLDGYHCLAITVRRLPTETFPTIVHRLTYLPFSDFVFTVHVRRLAKADIVKRTQSSLDRLNQQLLRKPDERQAVTVRQMQEKIRRLAEGEAVPLELEIILLVRAKTEEELGDKAAAIKATLQAMNGAQYYEASLPSTSRHLFTKTLPGWTGSRYQGFRIYCEDRTAADLMPLCSSFVGHPGPVQALFPGNDNNLVNAAMFLGEGDASTPQNLTALGAPGVGKSLALTKLELETDPHFAFTAIVEEGLSQVPYSRSHGVNPVVFRVDGNQTLNPLDTQKLPRSSFAAATQIAVVARMIGLPADEDKARRHSALISRHLTRLSNDHADEHMRKLSLEQRNALLRLALTVKRLSKSQGISELEAFGCFNEIQQTRPVEGNALLKQLPQADLDEFESSDPQSVRNMVFAILRPEEHLTLSSLCEYFELADQDEEECRWLATLLAPWCRGGSYGVMFDGATNVSLNGPVVHFELGFIPEAAKEIKTVVGFLIINGIRNHILNMPRHLKKRVIVEEVSRFIDIPGGEAILRELYEQFRKFNCQVLIVAQQYSRIADTPIRTALVGNTRAWFIFNTGDRRDVERLAEDLGLSSVAREAILRFPRPDQQIGAKYSEFLYYHTDARQPICGTVRYVRLPHELPASTQTAQPKHA
ncbi:MAG: hypothetical protein C5B50_05450 [Verrucomicrobia bacterium]|nr:MAG: hypothetical protein C5B50_05450 [Verrucomicrobiota bacterium]